MAPIRNSGSVKAASGAGPSRREPYPMTRVADNGGSNKKPAPETTKAVVQASKPKSLLDGHSKKEDYIKSLKPVTLKVAAASSGADVQRIRMVNEVTGEKIVRTRLVCPVCQDTMIEHGSPGSDEGDKKDRYPVLLHDTHALCATCAYDCLRANRRCPSCRKDCYLSDDEWERLSEAQENNEAAWQLIKQTKQVVEAFSTPKPSSMDKFEHTCSLELQALLQLQKVQIRWEEMDQPECTEWAEKLVNARDGLMEARGQRFDKHKNSYLECFEWNTYDAEESALYVKKAKKSSWRHATIRLNSGALYAKLFDFFEAGLSESLEAYQATGALRPELHPVGFSIFLELADFIDGLDGELVLREELYNSLNEFVQNDKISTTNYPQGTMPNGFFKFVYDMIAYVVINARK